MMESQAGFSHCGRVSAMTTSAQRFYIRSPDGRMIVGFDDLNAAGAVALDYGEGAHLVEPLQRAGSTP